MKFKKLSLILLITACAAGAAAFTACEGSDLSDGAAACNHVCESWTTTVDSCTAKKREGVCTQCGEKVTENLAPKGHSFGDWEDTVNNCKAHTLKRTCSDCGVTVTMTAMPSGHGFGEWEYVTDDCDETRQVRSCSECGVEETKNNAPKGHTFGEWTEDERDCFNISQKRTCEKCGADETRDLPQSGHVYENGACKNCGEPLIDGGDLSVLDKYNSTYGYEFFLKSEGREAELYSLIDSAVRAFHTDKTATCKKVQVGETEKVTYSTLTPINCSALGLDESTAVSVWKIFRDDNPLYYWLSNTVIFEKTQGMLYIPVTEEYVDGAARMEANDIVYNKVTEYSNLLTGESAYEIAKTFHDAIIAAIDYCYGDDGLPETADWAHGIMGVFKEKGGVCESYARTFQILLNYNGVENIMVTGDAVSKGDDGTTSERHAWNLVKVDGKWYWCDVTWDDTADKGDGVAYGYFLVNDAYVAGGAQFTESHVADVKENRAEEFLYDLPERAESKYVPEE